MHTAECFYLQHRLKLAFLKEGEAGQASIFRIQRLKFAEVFNRFRRMGTVLSSGKLKRACLDNRSARYFKLPGSTVTFSL